MVQVAHKAASALGADRAARLGSGLLQFGPTRRLIVQAVDRAVTQNLWKSQAINPTFPPQVVRDKAAILRAIGYSVERALDKKLISPRLTRKFIRSLAFDAFMREENGSAAKRFKEEHDGYGPPSFVVVGPGKLCNLHCKGCYASSGLDNEKLEWDVFERIIREIKELWGSGFAVITGGEPLAYRSQGKGVLDMAAAHPDVFFLMYTNGTLIDKATAARMAEVGNITPAISVEGWEERTDARRGKGVFQKILQAMANLREVGVPFGISLTATRENCEEILSDAFLDFFFEEQGALYGWIFQYMPIGRGFTLDLLPTPEQRRWMWERSWQVIREKKYFLPDFWNSGTASSGCISAGRQGGYLYIDWNGKVMPCVFVPYSPVNIHDIYKQGKNLNDVLEEPFFKAIREWQHQYGYRVSRPEQVKNWAMPCIIRDHHREFRRILEATEPDPEDKAALQALQDPAYRDGLIAYDEALAKLLDPIWEERYIKEIT